jgi:hypothetical protein
LVSVLTFINRYGAENGVFTPYPPPAPTTVLLNGREFGKNHTFLQNGWSYKIYENFFSDFPRYAVKKDNKTGLKIPIKKRKSNILMLSIAD